MQLLYRCPKKQNKLSLMVSISWQQKKKIRCDEGRYSSHNLIMQKIAVQNQHRSLRHYWIAEMNGGPKNTCRRDVSRCCDLLTGDEMLNGGQTIVCVWWFWESMRTMRLLFMVIERGKLIRQPNLCKSSAIVVSARIWLGFQHAQNDRKKRTLTCWHCYAG